MKKTLEQYAESIRTAARADLLDYVLYHDRSYETSRFHRIIADQLMSTLSNVEAVHGQEIEAEQAEGLRIMITLPPRHGKSRLISQEFPVWAIGNHPWLSVILTSYSASLAIEFGRYTRNLMRDSEQLFGQKIEEGASRVDRWSLDGAPHDSGVTCAGVGGAITGKGAHIAIIDDPIKNYEEAISVAARRRVYTWYQTVLRTRLAPGGAIILVMTRWHEDDLAGRLLADAKHGGEQWQVIDLPALAEEGDVLGREPGEALWPERFSRESLLRTKAAVGSYMFEAMYQQHPSTPSGTMFKRGDFRYWEIENHTYVLHRDNGEERFSPGSCLLFQTVDPTASDKSSADWFVCSTWILTPKGDLLLYDVFRAQMEGAEQPRLLIDNYRRYLPSFVGIETSGVGRTTYQMVRNAGVPVKELKADTSKSSRAIPVGARYEAHKVFHRLGMPGLDDWESELIAFPTGAHDDQVDTASYAAIVMQELMTNQKGTVIGVDIPSRISPI